MVHEHTSIRRVEFSETDMAGLVHFTNFFKYVETAERDLFEAAGVSLIETQPGQVAGWPRTRVDCKFSAPLRFGETVEIHLAVQEVKARALQYQFRIFRRNPDGSRTQAAKGHLSTVFTRLDSDGKLHALELPQTVLERIQAAPAECLKRPVGT